MTRIFFMLLALYSFLTGCASLPENIHQTESYAFTDTLNTPLGRFSQGIRDQAENNEDGFILLKDGLDAFVARAALADKAERSLDVQYYLYHEDLVGNLFSGILLRAADRGVRVKVLTNSLASNDVVIAHAGYSNYRKALLRNGVELYEMDKKLTRSQRKTRKGLGDSAKTSLHAKIFILDRNKIFIGSLNLDPRSFYENTEIGLMLSSVEVSERIAKTFVDGIAKSAFRLELAKDEEDDEYLLWHGYKDGEPVTFDVDPHTSFWLRLGAGFLSLLPVESQL